MTVFEGDLRELGLSEVLQRIGGIGGNGILTVQGGDDIVAVSFLRGGIVAADALNQTVEDGLGEVLTDQGLITAQDFEAAARDHQGGASGSLGELLVGRGLIGREELLDGLRLQTYRLMQQILSWREGEFKFYSGDEISYEEGFKPISVAELLIRSAEELGGPEVGAPQAPSQRARPPAPGEQVGRGQALDGPIPELDARYRPVPPSGVVRVLGRDGDGAGSGIWLSAQQAEVLARMDGETSAAAVARDLGLDPYEARLMLYNLLQHKLLQLVGEVDPRSVREAAVAPAGPLMAEIFTPPEPGVEESAAVAGDFEDVGRGPSLIRPWLGPGVAAVLMLGMVLMLLARPGTYLLPFPWQDNQLNTVERQLRQSLFLKIDRAAKVYFLVSAHYPDSLSDLVELELLSEADLRDPAGYVLRYSTDEVGYRIDLFDGQEKVEGFGTTESITGDFLLDPQLLRSSPAELPPLILLD